jgi:hypothetical protein
LTPARDFGTLFLSGMNDTSKQQNKSRMVNFLESQPEIMEFFIFWATSTYCQLLLESPSMAEIGLKDSEIPPHVWLKCCANYMAHFHPEQRVAQN